MLTTEIELFTNSENGECNCWNRLLIAKMKFAIAGTIYQLRKQNTQLLDLPTNCEIEIRNCWVYLPIAKTEYAIAGGKSGSIS